MTEKLSDFTQQVPTPFSFIAGANLGSPNQKYQVADINLPNPPSGGNLTFYVATTGSDSNPGTIGSPFASPQRGVDVALLYNYQGIYTWQVNIANGDYTTLPDGGKIAGDLNGTEGANPSVLGASASGTIVGQVTTVIGQTQQFFEIASVFVKPGSSVAALWTQGPIGLVVSGDITVGTTRLDGHVDQPFYSTGARGAVLFQGVNVTIDASITNTQSLGQAIAGSLEFTGPNIIFPGSAISASSGIFQSQFQAAVSWNGCSIVNGANFGSGTSTCFLSNHSLFSFDNTLTLGTGIVFSQDNSSIVTINGFTSANTGIPLLHRQPTTSDIYNIQWGVFQDSINDVINICYNDGGVIRTTQIGHHINTQTGTSYTLALLDQEGIVEIGNSGVNTVFIPTNASVNFPIGATVTVVQTGTGASSIAGVGGVTLHNAGSLTGQWASAIIYQRATNEWVQLNGAF